MLDLKLAFRFIFNLKNGSFSSYASWLSIIGIAIGVTALMLTTSIIDGFEKEVSDKLAGIEGQGRIKHFLNKPIKLEETQLKPLFNNSDYQINPYIRGICMIRNGKNLDGVIIEGIYKYPTLLSEDSSKYLENNQIIIGEPLASSLSAKVGDKVYLQSFSKLDLSMSSPEIFSFEVVSLFSSGLQEYDKNIVYLNIEEARSLLGYATSEVTGLIVDSCGHSITGISYPFYYETWKERHALLFEWLLAQQWPAYIMFGLITFVGLINLFAAIAMIIIEKGGAIAILICQGMDFHNLRRVFILQGTTIGIFGALIGGLFSIAIIGIQMKYGLFEIPSDVYLMDKIPFSFSLNKYFIILIFVGISSTIASWLPTHSFKFLKPAEVLHYE